MTAAASGARRALVLSGYWPPHDGGVERYAQAMAEELAGRGWEVHAAFSAVGAAAPRGSSSVRLHPYPVRTIAGRLPVPDPAAAGFRRVRRTLARTPFDLVIVMSHHYLANVLLARAVTARETLWINHVSGHVPAGGGVVERLAHRYEHVLAGLQRRTCTRAAGVSTAAAAWLGHLGVHTTTLLPNAVRAGALRADTVTSSGEGPDAGPTTPTTPTTLRIVHVGRIEPHKGWDTAIEVVRRLALALPDGHEVVLDVAGGGTRAAELAALARGVPQVRLHGPLPHDEVIALLARSDVLLLPSRYPEGLPTVLLEAGTVALPVVTFPAGGTTDLVVDGVTGRIVDDVEGAAAALLALHADRPAARALGRALEARVRDGFTWPRVVDALLEEVAHVA